jgi:hypothetical protein
LTWWVCVCWGGWCVDNRHPEWILRTTDKGQPANSANCGKWFYGLDVTNADVQAFMRDTLTTVSHGAWSVGACLVNAVCLVCLALRCMPPLPLYSRMYARMPTPLSGH